MEIGQCDRCYNTKLLIYVVKDEFMEMKVCWECGIEAKKPMYKGMIEVKVIELKGTD